MSQPLSRRGSLTSANRPQMVYIFARDYQTAGEVARAFGLGRLRWQYVAAYGTLMGRRNIRLWTYDPEAPDGPQLRGHPQYAAVARQAATLRAGGELVEDRVIINLEGKRHA